MASHSTLSALVHNQPVSVLASPLLEKNGTPAWRHHEVSTETPLREGHNQNIGCPHFSRRKPILAVDIGEGHSCLGSFAWLSFGSFVTSQLEMLSHKNKQLRDF